MWKNEVEKKKKKKKYIYIERAKRTWYSKTGVQIAGT